jgi:hypothetical protein
LAHQAEQEAHRRGQRQRQRPRRPSDAAPQQDRQRGQLIERPRTGTGAAKGAINMSNTIRRLWVRLALSAGLVTAAAAAATWHTDPILLRLAANHCEPVVRDQ